MAARFTPASKPPFRGYDLIGRVFGRLTVVERAPGHSHGRTWRCACVCGGERISLSARLIAGQMLSCGCMNTREERSARTRASRAVRSALRSPYIPGAPYGVIRLSWPAPRL